jgi:hypothetical protein
VQPAQYTESWNKCKSINSELDEMMEFPFINLARHFAGQNTWSLLWEALSHPVCDRRTELCTKLGHDK